MRRFFLSIPQAIDLVIKSAIKSRGGEIFVLKMPVINIKDLIEVIIEEYSKKIGKDPNSIKIKIIGPRPGEKIDEELISSIEISNCYETGDMYIIYPFHLIDFGYMNFEDFKPNNGCKKIPNENFHYSTENATLLTKTELRVFLKDLNLI